MHEIVKGNLETYLESRLPAAVERELEAHLAACGPCKQLIEDARQGSRLLKALAVPDAPEPSPGFYLKVRQSIEAAQGFSFWGLLRPAFRQVAFATCMLLVLLGSYYLSLQSNEFRSSTAELLLDMPVEHEAPAMLAVHNHPADNPSEWCLQCWRAHQRGTAPSEPGEDRERVMAALLAAPVGD